MPAAPRGAVTTGPQVRDVDRVAWSDIGQFPARAGRAAFRMAPPCGFASACWWAVFFNSLI
jgi:hypothetical protein